MNCLLPHRFFVVLDLMLMLSTALFSFHSWYSSTPEFLFYSFLMISTSLLNLILHMYCFPDFVELSLFPEPTELP